MLIIVPLRLLLSVDGTRCAHADTLQVCQSPGAVDSSLMTALVTEYADDFDDARYYLVWF